jgi:hypothetical protein
VGFFWWKKKDKDMSNIPDPFFSGEERRRTTRRIAPDGRPLEEIRRETSGQDSEERIIEEEITEIPQTWCGCTPQGVHDLFTCMNHECKAIVCGRHCRTCQKCGFNYCSKCLDTSIIHDQPTDVCTECKKDIESSPLMKFIRFLFYTKY